MANPNGKKGSQKHQKVQRAELKLLEEEFKSDEETIQSAIEVPVGTPAGHKRHRIADVAAFSLTDKITYHKIVQIGKTDKAGKPVKRELEAMDDMEQHTGLKVKFVDYENYNLEDDGKTD